MAKSSVSADQITNVANPNLATVSSVEDLAVSHSPIYLEPESILDGENVRPDESIADHTKRINDLARAIAADGQQIPIKVREEGDRYKIVDGQGRRDALNLLNVGRRSEGLEPLLAWCVLDQSADSWATALKLNLQRKNYSDIELADLIQQARKRYGWTSKGGGKKCAEFFGITEQLLVEYNLIAAAPSDVKDRIASGELTKSAALTLLKVALGTEKTAVKKRDTVVSKAQQIAQAARETSKGVSATPASGIASTPQGIAAKAIPGTGETVQPPKAPVVQAKHIAQAAREIAISTGTEQPVIKRNRTEILQTIQSLHELMPAKGMRCPEGKKFLKTLMEFAEGAGTPKQLQNRWNDLVGIVKIATPNHHKPETKPAKAKAKKSSSKPPAAKHNSKVAAASA